MKNKKNITNDALALDGETSNQWQV